MTTLREAAQQALEAWDGGDIEWFKRAYTVMENLRAALAQQQANPPGCDHCNHPLYAATKCRVCGRVTEWAEPVEPVAWVYTGIKQDGTEHGPHLVWKPEYMDAMSASKGAKATPLYTAPPQQAEPNAEYERGFIDGMQKQAQSSVDRAVNRMAEPVQEPPQRKPLTQEQLYALYDEHATHQEEGPAMSGWFDFARAVERAHGIKE